RLRGRGAVWRLRLASLRLRLRLWSNALGVDAQLVGELRTIFGRQTARACDVVDAGRHHRNADDAFEAFIEGRADDDIGLLVHLLADAGGGLVNLVERK